MENIAKEIVTDIVFILSFFYEILELVMPFLILSIYNTVKELERKSQK